MSDNVGQVAQAIGYNSFLAIPSALLVAVGAFGVFANPATIHQVLRQRRGRASARRDQPAVRQPHADHQRSQGGLVILLVGVVLGMWSLSGSMQTLMWGLNVTFQRQESRGFMRRRLIALAMVRLHAVGVAIVFVLFVLAPKLSHWAGEQPRLRALTEHALDGDPMAGGGDRAAAGVCDVDAAGARSRRSRASLFTIGGVTAVIGWLVLSDVFAYLHQPVRVIQQDVGLAGGGDRRSRVAAAVGAGVAVRGRDQCGADRRSAARGRVRLRRMSDPDTPQLDESHREQRLVKNEMAFRAHNERRAELEEAGGVGSGTRKSRSCVNAGTRIAPRRSRSRSTCTSASTSVTTGSWSSAGTWPPMSSASWMRSGRYLVVEKLALDP